MCNERVNSKMGRNEHLSNVRLVNYLGYGQARTLTFTREHAIVLAGKRHLMSPSADVMVFHGLYWSLKLFIATSIPHSQSVCIGQTHEGRFCSNSILIREWRLNVRAIDPELKQKYPWLRKQFQTHSFQ